MADIVTVQVNKAERDALAQIVAKADLLRLDNYERDLLQQLLDKVDRDRGAPLTCRTAAAGDARDRS